MKEMSDFKRKITLFASVAIFADFLLDTLYNLLTINVSLFYQSDMASNILSFSFSAVTLVLFLVLGYALNRDKVKAIIFSGALYFASYLPNLILSLVSVISSASSYFSLAGGVSYLLRAFEYVIGIVIVSLKVSIAVYAYTAFEGINERFSEEGMSGFTMSVSRARKRYIVATVVQILSTTLITSIPLMFTLLSDENISGFVVKLFAWISSVVLFFIIYSAGYRPGKNHTEAMAFFSAYALGGGISSLISALFSAVIAPMISKVLTSGIGDEVTQEVLSEMFAVIDVDTFSFAASSPLLLILSFVVTLYVFKFFFEDETEGFYAQ